MARPDCSEQLIFWGSLSWGAGGGLWYLFYMKGETLCSIVTAGSSIQKIKGIYPSANRPQDVSYSSSWFCTRFLVAPTGFCCLLRALHLMQKMGMFSEGGWQTALFSNSMWERWGSSCYVVEENMARWVPAVGITQPCSSLPWLWYHRQMRLYKVSFQCNTGF